MVNCDCQVDTIINMLFDLHQIHTNVQTYEIDAKFTWVKGHQDQTTATNELPLEAVMNIEADDLAAQRYDEQPLSKTKCDLLPACPAALHVRHLTRLTPSKYSTC